MPVKPFTIPDAVKSKLEDLPVLNPTHPILDDLESYAFWKHNCLIPPAPPPTPSCVSTNLATTQKPTPSRLLHPGFCPPYEKREVLHHPDLREVLLGFTKEFHEEVERRLLVDVPVYVVDVEGYLVPAYGHNELETMPEDEASEEGSLFTYDDTPKTYRAHIRKSRLVVADADPGMTRRTSARVVSSSSSSSSSYLSAVAASPLQQSFEEEKNNGGEKGRGGKRSSYPAHIRELLDQAMLDSCQHSEEWMLKNREPQEKMLQLMEATGLGDKQIRQYFHNCVRRAVYKNSKQRNSKHKKEKH